MNVTATIAVPLDGPYFDGHFPGHPILPGVAQIALSLAALARETGGDVPLRGISRMRLRRAVLPGDRLDLGAQGSGGDKLRVELRRAGDLVADADLLLGVPRPVNRDTITPPDATVPPDTPELDSLLPHRPPMRFIDTILGEAPDGLQCGAVIPAGCGLADGGSVPAAVGLEAAAQAAAMWEAMARRRGGAAAAPRVGYLVALRDVEFFAARIPTGLPLQVSVTLEAAVPPLAHYRAALSRDGNALLRGTIVTYLKTGGAQ